LGIGNTRKWPRGRGAISATSISPKLYIRRARKVNSLIDSLTSSPVSAGNLQGFQLQALCSTVQVPKNSRTVTVYVQECPLAYLPALNGWAQICACNPGRGWKSP
jgi:hypothetical protein